MTEPSTQVEPYARPTAPIVHPATGEVVPLDSPTDVLAAHLMDVRDLEGALRSHKQHLTRELLDRMDREATWTVRAGGFKVVGKSPADEEVFDGEQLWNGLHSIARDVGLSDEAILNAVTEERVYKVSKRGVSALRKLGGEVARVIDRCVELRAPDRRVSVSVDR